ncbi:MAG: NADP oxidoreductase, partial [Gemmatimonadales bacterium]
GHERFRFFGNVEYGSHISLSDLRRHYHAVCFATGAQTDRRLGIPGEDLAGSHPATDFVAWYNGHPDYEDLTFNLDAESVAVVGVGNVAVDVARILCRTTDELARTDIADHALEALSESRVTRVYMLGRRGPAQAAFTNAEVKELGELDGADVTVLPDEVRLDEFSKADVAAADDAKLVRKIEIVQSFVRKSSGKPRSLCLRFLVSPVELTGTGGAVSGMKLVRNRLERSGDRLRAVPTDSFEDLDVQLVFRSVGYHGVALPDLPFDEGDGIVPNDGGRVTGEPGIYVSGWIKRGPTGIIGTNKPDGAETARAILSDLRVGRSWSPAAPTAEAAMNTVRTAQPHLVTYDDWQAIDESEVARAQGTERPRVKYVARESLLELLDRTA